MFVLVECNIPDVVTGLLAEVYKAIIILIPIGIVLFGTIDFVKAIAAKDEAAISASGKTFLSRLITGCLTFFVLTIVTWIFRTLIGSVGGSSSAMSCALEILGGTSSYQSNASINQMNKEMCYGTQYGACMANNHSPNASYDCNIAANNICGSNKTVKTTKPTTATTKVASCQECIKQKQEEINICIKEYDKDAYENNNINYNEIYSKCLNSYEGTYDGSGSYFMDAAATYFTCKENRINENKWDAETMCLEEGKKLQEYITKFDLSYDYKTQMPCAFDKSNNCYSVEDYQNDCINIGKNKQESGNMETFCQQKICEQCI